MFSIKKKSTQAKDDEEPEPIDFVWAIVVCKKIGYTEDEVMSMYFRKLADIINAYQKLYNFEKKNLLYGIEENNTERKIDSPRDLR